MKYVRYDTKVCIVCKIHGVFHQSPNIHIRGAGCNVCGNIQIGQKLSSSLEVYKAKLSKVTSKYKVIGALYTNNRTPILHRCNVCTHRWNVAPTNMLGGQGCPSCASYGFDPSQPAILYYLSVKQGEAYKIGITNRSVKQRYSNEELQDIEVLREWEFESGLEAYDLEQIILKSYKHLKYTGPQLLKSGHTEMFREDILNGNKIYV